MNAEIDRAYLWFTVDGTYENALQVDIRGELTPDPNTYSAISQPISRTLLTSAKITWPITQTWTSWERWTSPDISSVIQEVIDQPSWQEGNAISLIVKNSAVSANMHRRVMGYERDNTFGAASARLIVYFSPPPKSRAYYPVNDDQPDLDWDEEITFNGEDVIRAYRYGYNHPPINKGVVILAFGQQLNPSHEHNPLGVWAVGLPRDEGSPVENDWVIEVSQAYIDGYTANPEHTERITVIIGTNNYNNKWACTKQPLDISPYWEESGGIWADVVNAIDPTSKVTVYGGSDIESWVGEDPDWTACGDGTIAWLDGYTAETDRKMVNFGDFALGRNPPQWTEDELYELSWGRPEALASPLIYTPFDDFHWAELVVKRRFYFFSIGSANGKELPSGSPSYIASEAWHALYDELSIRQYLHALPPTVSTFDFDYEPSP